MKCRYHGVWKRTVSRRELLLRAAALLALAKDADSEIFALHEHRVGVDRDLMSCVLRYGSALGPKSPNRPVGGQVIDVAVSEADDRGGDACRNEDVDRVGSVARHDVDVAAMSMSRRAITNSSGIR